MERSTPPVLPLRPIASLSTAGEVAQQLERFITDGNLKPGDQLPAEAELARALNVARSTVREAKHALVGRGLVELRGTRGAFVAAGIAERSAVAAAVEKLSSSVGADLYEARRVLEAAAAEFAATRASHEDLDGLMHLLEDIEAESPAGGDRALHLRFHSALVEASKNQVLVALYAQIAHIIQHHHGPYYRQIADASVEIKSHRALLEAVRSGDPQLAADAMRSHLDDVELLRQSAIRGGLDHFDLES